MLKRRAIFLRESFWRLLSDYQHAEELETPSLAVEHLIARLIQANMNRTKGGGQ